MPAIIASTEVNRAVDEVFAYATDPTRFAEWQKGVVDGHLEGSVTPSMSPPNRSGKAGHG